MSNTNTGGPAFPSGLIDPSTPEDAIQAFDKGMTLRDYFAAKAMQAHISSSMGSLSKAYVNDTDAINPIIAKASYEMADAMLKVRGA